MIDSSGRVGIGTTSPNAKIHSYQGSSGQTSINSSANGLAIEDNASNGLSILTPSTAIGSIFFGDEADNFIGGFRYDHTDNSLATYVNNSERLRIDSSGKVYFGNQDSAASSGYIDKQTSGDYEFKIHASTSTSVNRAITFHNRSNTEAMRIDSLGRVGIGTDSPECDLHIEGNGVSSLRFGNIGTSANSALRISRDDTTIANNPLGYLEFGGKDNTGNVDTAHAYIGAVAGTHAAGSNPTNLTFGTTPSGSSTIAEVMRIDESGNVGIGTSSPARQLTIQSSGAQMALLSDTTGSSVLNLGDTADDNIGRIQYDNANDKMVFRTNTVDRLTIDSSGNVGIGTSSPSNILHISASAPIIRLTDTDTSAYGLVSASATDGSLILEADAGNTVANSDMIFRVDGSEGMRIDSSGNVGIGTTSPSDYYADNLVVNAQNEGGITLIGTSAHENYLMWADGTSGTDRYSGYLSYNHSSNFMRFATNGGSERMRIDSSGNVHVGKTTSSNTTAGTSLLEDGRFAFIVDQGSGGQEVGVINNQTSGTYVIDFRQADTDVGRIRVTASATEYQTSSDYRLKENVEYDWDATTRLNELKPARFSWIANPDVGTVDGFLAHEVSDIVPESIGGEKDEVDNDGNPVYQGIDQSKLVPLLTKALQEANARIDDLTTRLEALENA